MAVSVFQKYISKAYPYQFKVEIEIPIIAGGTPSDPKVAEGWLRSKLGDKDVELVRTVTEIMAERGVDESEAVSEAALKGLTGFKRDENGIYVEGRQLKACLKEAVNIAANAGSLPAKGWGNPSDRTYLKGIKAWFPEHVFVMEDKLHLGADKATDINQRFVASRYGTAISYEEYLENAKIKAHIETDYKFSEEEWGVLWLTAQHQGLGASRSQGFGSFVVTDWKAVTKK